MVCAPVQRDNPRAFSTNHALSRLYHNIQCRPCTVRSIGVSLAKDWVFVECGTISNTDFTKGGHEKDQGPVLLLAQQSHLSSICEVFQFISNQEVLIFFMEKMAVFLHNNVLEILMLTNNTINFE